MPPRVLTNTFPMWWLYQVWKRCRKKLSLNTRMCTGVRFNGFSIGQFRKTSLLSHSQHFAAGQLGDLQDFLPHHPALVSLVSCLPSPCPCPAPPALSSPPLAPTASDVSVGKDPIEPPPPHPSCSSPPPCCPLCHSPHLSSSYHACKSSSY